MRKSIYYLLLSAFMALLSACSDNDLYSGWRPSDNETPVSVTADFATWAPQTRAAGDVNLAEKKGFTDGDVIHVQGEFEVGTSKVWRYDTYKYSNGRWKPNSANGDSSLKWPWNATKGSFTAYYLPAAKETLSDGTSYTCDMGDSPLLHDPLVAYANNVERDYAVNFQFEHMCTRLVIENTKNNYAEEYWFYKENISNVFKLGLEPETDEATGATYNRLKLSFVSDKSKNEGTISAVKVMTGSGSTGAASNAGYIVYYLQPGKYYGSDLNYSGNRLYLKLNVDALDAPPEPEGGTTDGLVAGRTYFLDIEKAKGVINTEETEDPWDNKDSVVTDFDVQELIEAINNGKEFENILKLDNAGNLVLTKNLDFQYKDFIPKNVPTNIVFDGGYHYIMNTKHQLIDRNYGAIRNLEIRQANITDYYAGHNGVIGVLAANNQGYIDNIRMRNNTINLLALPESENVTSVGGVVGSHENGQITNVCMIGTNSISVSDKPGADGTRGRVLFGGIVGQANGSSPAIKNVSMLQDENGNVPVISLKLSCSKGIYSVGGVVGMLTTGIEGCTLEATIDCSESDAADCCVGGLFGREQAFESNGGFTISKCNVTGKVHGAYATTVKTNSNTVLGRSMVGGIGGAVQTSDMVIIDCRSFCEVYDCFNSGKGYNVSAVTDEVFGSGAAFGRLTANPMTTITRCTAWGKITATPLPPTASRGGSFVGTFVGYAVNGFKQENNNMDNTGVNVSLPFCGYDWKQ